MALNPDQREKLEELHTIVVDELESALEAYAEAAARVTTLTEVANGLRSVLDA